MNKEEYLLICLMEECAEVQHACAKALRFGLEDRGPNYVTTNKFRIEDEMIDVVAVHQMLQEANVLSGTGNYENRVKDKKNKVENFMHYSAIQGCLTEDK